jgi:hypothetical protein
MQNKSEFKFYAGFVFILLLLIGLFMSKTANTYYCNWCGDSYSGRGFTSAMYVVNKVDSENSPLNSYCSRKCTIQWIRSQGRQPLKVN